MIKKLCIAVMTVICLCGCSTGSHEERAVDNAASVALDTAQVVERVNEIYADVFQYYTLLADSARLQGRLVGIKPPSVKFCTRDWNDWVTRVNSFDAEHNDGMMGFFEADYWIMGQDWGDLSLSDVNVASMTDSTAIVEFKLHNLGSEIPVRLNMALEDGAWKIDNFIDVANDLDWKANMKEYLSGETANQ